MIGFPEHFYDSIFTVKYTPGSVAYVIKKIDK